MKLYIMYKLFIYIGIDMDIGVYDIDIMIYINFYIYV